jgi:two-component system sensor histidine kinase VicK
LKLLFERLDLSVITVTRDLRIEFANSSALLLLLLLPERPAGGQDLPELWPELSLTKLAAELFKPGASPGEWHVAPQDSDSRYLVRGIPALGLDTVVIVIRDVTESERLIEAEREFISNAAHELRTPLAAIVSAIDVLELGAKEVPVERDRFLEHIGREADRLVRLTASLLALARAQTLGERVRTELLELKPLLEEVIESVCTEADLRVALTCPEGLVAIANRELTLQALENLCANALRYTSEGRIDIKAREVEGNAVLIDIIDTGPGIPSELRGRVLHRFVRGGDGSTGFGLGLAIASQAVDAIGGTLELDSEPGRGTTARVTLPAARLLTA